MKKSAVEKVIKFIRGYQEKNGWSPSIREIAEGVGIPGTATVHRYLLDLAKEKRIIYKGIRQIRIIEGERNNPKCPTKMAGWCYNCGEITDCEVYNQSKEKIGGKQSE